MKVKCQRPKVGVVKFQGEKEKSEGEARMEIQGGVLQGGPEFIGTHGGVGRPWSRITASQNDTECGRGEVSSLPAGSFSEVLGETELLWVHCAQCACSVDFIIRRLMWSS